MWRLRFRIRTNYKVQKFHGEYHLSTHEDGALTHKEGGVLEGGRLRRALAVHRNSPLEDGGFAHVSRGQSEVLDVEGA